MKKLSKFVLLAVALAMVFTTLAGCTKRDNNDKGDKDGKGDEVSYKQFEPESDGTYSVAEDKVRLLGRTYSDPNDGFTYFSWSNSGFEVRFYGTGLEAYLNTNMGENDIPDNAENMPILSVYIDGKDNPEDLYKIVKLDKKEGWYTLAEGLEEGYHTLTVRKRTRNYYGILAGVAAGVSKLKVTGGKLAEPPKAKELKLEVVGDSISCGDGIYENPQDFGGTMNDGWSTYAAFAARNLNADLNTIAISGNGLISSLFGDSLLDLPDQYPYVDKQIYRANGKEVEWDFSKYVADVVVINLGTNDRAGVGEGKKFTYEQFEDAYVEFCEYIKSKYPNVKIIATLGAMGSELKPNIEKAVERANANADEQYVYTMWLEPDPGNDGLSGDKTHPSLKAHERYGKQLTDKIKEILDLK